MILPIRSLVIVLISLHAIIACDKQSTPKVDAAPIAISPEITAAETDEPKPAAPTAVEIKPNDETAEKPSGKVYRTQFHDNRFPGKLPPGEVLGGFAFMDTVGENFVVFTRTETVNKDDIRSNVLRIKHVVQKADGTVTELRSYTERVDGCDFDVMLDPFFGDWSVSDVDNNGIGEASFAYTADCVSDVSPLNFKVFVTEGGEKYVLRGRSYRQFPDEEPHGGEYTADKMPPAFLTKAKQVWETTAHL